MRGERGGAWGEGLGAARAEQRARSSARGAARAEQRGSMVFPLTRRMSRIKFPIRDRFHEIEFVDGGKPIFRSLCCFEYFMQTLRKRKKAFSGTQSPKCGALAPALVHRATPQKKGAQCQVGAEFGFWIGHFTG